MQKATTERHEIARSNYVTVTLTADVAQHAHIRNADKHAQYFWGQDAGGVYSSSINIDQHTHTHTQ